MDQRAPQPTGRTGLKPRHPLRTGEGQPFGRDLRHRSAQLMPSRLHVREPHILIEQLSHRNFKPLGNAHKRLPLLITDLFADHFVHP